MHKENGACTRDEILSRLSPSFHGQSHGDERWPRWKCRQIHICAVSSYKQICTLVILPVIFIICWLLRNPRGLWPGGGSHPISDLTIKMYTLFQTLWGEVILAILNKIYSVRDFVTPQMMCVLFFLLRFAMSAEHPRPNKRNIHPISDQNGKIYTLFQKFLKVIPTWLIYGSPPIVNAGNHLNWMARRHITNLVYFKFVYNELKRLEPTRPGNENKI